jgi:hypothetical protein
MGELTVMAELASNEQNNSDFSSEKRAAEYTLHTINLTRKMGDEPFRFR